MNGIAFASGMLGAITVTVPLELAAARAATGARCSTASSRLDGGGEPGALLRGARRKPRRAARAPLAAQLREFASLARDPAFWRIALCIGASQFAAVSLGTLWVATWLRDVAGYTQAEVRAALLALQRGDDRRLPRLRPHRRRA